jgi:hypothetical protein
VAPVRVKTGIADIESGVEFSRKNDNAFDRKRDKMAVSGKAF